MFLLVSLSSLGLAQTVPSGCKAPASNDCHGAAFQLIDTRTPPSDPPLGLLWMRRACEAGNLRSCTTLSAISMESVSGLVVDPVEGFQAAKKACDGGERLGCANLAWHYVDGSGTPADVRKGFQILLDGCQQDHAPSCANLGDLYSEGGPVKRDPAQAKIAYQRACDQDFVYACERILHYGL